MDEGGGKDLSDCKLSEKSMMLVSVLTLIVLLIMLATSKKLFIQGKKISGKNLDE